ncbi:MAG TPA: DUF3168 domain-containing protein [Candidatus Olsenella pullicola]|nr:DUF3168 domain-containing protein [Candidatus Olsenella pullicola]
MDIEGVVIDYLNGAGVGATAYPDVPRKRPAAFVVVERVGGPRGEGGTFAAMLDIQCWAAARSAAASLAGAVEDAMADIPASVGSVAGSDLTSTFRDRDLESGTPRYHVVCTIYCNG